MGEPYTAADLPVVGASSVAGCVRLLRRVAKFKRETQAPAARRRSEQYRAAGDHAAALHRHQLADLREVEASELETAAAQLEYVLARQAERRQAILQGLHEADAADLEDRT